MAAYILVQWNFLKLPSEKKLKKIDEFLCFKLFSAPKKKIIKFLKKIRLKSKNIR